MTKIEPSSTSNNGQSIAIKSSLFADLRELFKAGVLIANVLPVFTGFCLALYFTNQSFEDFWQLFVLTTVSSTFIMAGALIINNWYDVDIDTIMKRTQKRPTVTGRMSLQTVLWMGIAFSIIGLVLLCFTTLEAAIWAFIGWFTYVIPYTMWSKRRYTMNTLIGSVSGAVTPMIGWAVIDSTYHIVPIILFLLMFIWQVPHTFAIAIRKYEEYKAAGVAMLPVVHGYAITIRQTVIYIACLLPLPFLLADLGLVFVSIATLLNVVWLIIGIRGFTMKNTEKWARMIFLYSLNYLVILLFLMVIVTIV
ncbi:heme o synthase [Salinibacillus xinjiangensis]|uniref:Protoheme IX farnesyltransferase n=1 Tax=Salinibacillus xinjiangensis TaxID=1229268 RepID=A0A6G1X985_9BACI|nr:heme o synthase [Salinibacillus xinjiangensis]MRG87466.1 protoheme IX farnesyltransferase [Salinibacillus xinjiangensis]